MKVFGIIFLLSLNVFAQQTGVVSGKVTWTGGTLERARVTLVSRRSKTTTFEQLTDAAGNYRFEAIPVGAYDIRAKGLCINTVALCGAWAAGGRIDVAGGTVNTINLELVWIQPRFEDVVVVAAGDGQRLSEVSKTVDVIDGQEMRERADITLVDSLRTIPGFRVQQLGGFGRTASIKTRGLRNQDTAILVDGIRFRDASSITGDASPFLSDITLTSVARAEVLRGSGSSVYGTNAIGGVVDLRTPDPERGFHGQLSGAFGGLGLRRFRGNISKATNDERFGFNLGLARTAYTEGIDGNDNAHNTNFQSRVNFELSHRTAISARFFVSDAYVRLNNNPTYINPLPPSPATIVDARPLALAELRRYEAGTPINQLNLGDATFIPGPDDPDNYQKSLAFTGQLSLLHVFNDQLSFEGYYQALTTSRRNTNGILGVGSQPFSGADETFLLKGQVHTADGHFKWRPDRTHTITAGYEHEWERLSNRDVIVDPIRAFSVRVSQSSNTFYVQDLLSLVYGRLQLSGGFRAQSFSLRAPIFDPANNPTYQNLALRDPSTAYTADGSASYYFRSTNTKLRLHVGNGYRVAALYERYGSFRFGAYSSVGDPNLKPEKSIAFDGGIDQYLGGDKVKLTATYFYTDISRAIDFAFCVPQCLPSNDPLNRFSGYYNTEGRVARGLETSAELKPTKSTSIFTSYTFVNSDERNPLNLSIPMSPGIPSHQFTAVVTQRFGRAWVNFDFVGSSSYLFPFYNFNFATFAENYFYFRFKGSRRGDLTAGYTFPLNKERANLRLFGTIENLFDHQYLENGFMTPGRNARVGLSFAF